MREITQNLIAFMERVPVTGKEAVAWVQAYAALQEQLAAFTAPPAQPVGASNDAH